MRVLSKVSLLVAAAVLAAPAQAQTVKAGIEAWQRGEHQQAVAIWRPLAEGGDADAAFNLGQAYRLGRGVAIDLAAAQTWLDQAARKDHVDAQTTLGLLLFENGNRTGGMRWLGKAADAGEPRALLIYGTALFNGDGIVRDPVRAYAYVSRAAAQGLAPAKATLAQMDEVMPLDQRKEGVALAQEFASRKKPAAPPPATTPVARPVEKAAPPAKAPAPAATGGWRIQLGAFSKRGSAEALYERLSGAEPLSGKQRYLVPGGAVTRLQVGPFPTRAAATAACSAMASQGQACFPVAPK